jgi:hypothetical protein
VQSRVRPLVNLAAAVCLLAVAGCEFFKPAEQQAVAPPPPPPVEITTVRVFPLLPGQAESQGYRVYVYLIDTGSDSIRSAAAICGFLGSEASRSGNPERDNPYSTALYYLPQVKYLPRTGPVGREGAPSLATVVDNYDKGRARGLAAKVGGLPRGIYLVTYIDEPLPSALNPEKLEVVEIGGLSPKLLYEYVIEYNNQFAPGGGYWRTPTARQVGIRVAQMLALVTQAKRISEVLDMSAIADPSKVDEALARPGTLPPACESKPLSHLSNGPLKRAGG